jgi:hypothetical protein
MELIKYIIPIFSVAVLCAGWVLVQIVAKKMKTKNHFDHLNSGCGGCICGGVGDNCVNSSENDKLNLK